MSSLVVTECCDEPLSDDECIDELRRSPVLPRRAPVCSDIPWSELLISVADTPLKAFSSDRSLSAYSALACFSFAISFRFKYESCLNVEDILTCSLLSAAIVSSCSLIVQSKF